MNKQEYENIYDTYAHKLRDFAQSFLRERDLAEEVVQQVFYTIWENRRRLSLDKPFAYLLAATKNEALKEIKRKKRFDKSDPNNNDQIILQKVEIIEPSIRFEAVQLAIEKLPKKCKIIMKLKVEDGLTHTEIAKILNISEKTIENQVSIAFKKIRQSVKKYASFLGAFILLMILYML